MRHFLGFFLLLYSFGLASQEELVLGIHTDEPAPAIGALLAEANPDGLDIRIQSFASVDKLWDELRAGRIDLALVDETGREEAGVALVAEVYPSVLHILYQGDTTPGNLGELLRSGPIWAGAPGSIGHRVARLLARDFGLQANELSLLDDAWTVEPQVYFIFGGILAPDALSRLDGFRLYSLDDPAAPMRGSVAEGIALRYPSLRSFMLPAQVYPSLNDAAALTLSVSSLLVARDTLDEQVTYDMAVAAQEMLPRIAAVYPLAGIPKLKAGVQQSRALRLHPGAQRYRDRDLPGFFERNSEILGLSATFVVTSASALVAWRRYRRQSRKDNLDTYYRKLLEYRTALAEGESDRESMAARIRATQADVMSLVIDERIDADGALLAFLSLSNQMLAEAQSSTREKSG